VLSTVAQCSRERKGQKGHLSKVSTSAEKLLRFGVGENKLLSSFNQVIYPHSVTSAGDHTVGSNHNDDQCDPHLSISMILQCAPH
jgi:hypothetical protein